MTPRTPDDIDPLLGDYFHAQRPTPWPPAHPGPVETVCQIASRGSGGADAGARPGRLSSATRSRLTLALSAGLVLAGGLALTPPGRPAASPSAGTPAMNLMDKASGNAKNVIHDLNAPKTPPR